MFLGGGVSMDNGFYNQRENYKLVIEGYDFHAISLKEKSNCEILNCTRTVESITQRLAIVSLSFSHDEKRLPCCE